MLHQVCELLFDSSFDESKYLSDEYSESDSDFDLRDPEAEWIQFQSSKGRVATEVCSWRS